MLTLWANLVRNGYVSCCEYGELASELPGVGVEDGLSTKSMGNAVDDVFNEDYQQ